MYAVRTKKLLRWLLLCSIMVGLIVMPVLNLEVTYWMSKQGASPEAGLITDLGLGINGLILSTAFGIVSGGVGFAVGAAWLVGQSL